jgi:hypothetical protein
MPMGWNDDSWRDGYDAWKLQGPDDDYDEPEECSHEHRDVDTLEGTAYCGSCGRTWTLTTAELDRELRLQTELMEMMYLEDRRQWWRDLRDKVLSVVWYRWRRKPAPVLDDDIPF